jgi:hypothetical protein
MIGNGLVEILTALNPHRGACVAQNDIAADKLLKVKPSPARTVFRTLCRGERI